MDINDRMREANEAGYGLLAKDDNQEIYGRGDLPCTLEFDGAEWTLHLRDFDFNPQGHQYLGNALLDPGHAFMALKTLDPNQLQDWML